MIADALAEARDLCEHGEWAAHLRKTGIPDRTATRMMRLARAGIKTATVADLGVGRVDEILARTKAPATGLVWPETGEIITGDEIVRIAEFADCAHEISGNLSLMHRGGESTDRCAFMDIAKKEENPWMKNRMAQAMPDGFLSADTWLRWFDDLVHADASRETDPDAFMAVVERSPWLPGRLFPDLDPASIVVTPNPNGPTV